MLTISKVGPKKLEAAKGKKNARIFVVRHRKSDGKRTEPTFARHEHAEAYAERKGSFRRRPACAFDDLIETFKDGIEDWDVSNAHVALSKSALDRLAVPHFGSMQIQDIDEPQVAEFRRVLADDNSEFVTKAVLSLVRRALDQAVDEDLLRVNPFDRLRPVPHDLRRAWEAKRPQRVVLPSRRRVGRLLQKTTGLVRVAVYLALLAGLRVGEILALRWRHIEGGILDVRWALTVDDEIDEPKSHAGNRSFKMVPQLVAELDAWRAGRKLDPDDFIVREPNEAPPSYEQLRRLFVRQQIELGLATRADGTQEAAGATRFHEMRHACAALWIWSDVPEPVISAWMGHADFHFTLNTYAYLFDEAEAGLPEWSVSIGS